MNQFIKQFCVFLCFILGCIIHGYGQTNTEQFGQNRVQYKTIDWKFYEAKLFKIYHYDRGGRELARFVAEQAEQDVVAIEKRLGGLFPDKISIMLYNNYDDYWQSNIGLFTERQLQQDNTGKLDVVGDKLLVYFNGDHSDLKRQLREGMANIVMERLLFGENFKEIIKNSISLDLPDWVKPGYVAYVVNGWNSTSDSKWKNLLLKKENQKFVDLSYNNNDLAGQAFWKYIAATKGEKAIRSLLFLTQLKGNFHKSVETALGMKLPQVLDSLMTYYLEQYKFEQQLYDNPIEVAPILQLAIPQNDAEIRNMMVSPRGSDIAYVKWENGKFKVILEKKTINKGKIAYEKSTILQGGVLDHNEIADPAYPMMAWSNTGFKLGIIYKRKDRIVIKVYNSVKGTMQNIIVPKNRFERVLSFSFMEDDDKIVLSAIKRGQSDLFEMTLKRSRLEQITDDAWDDLKPMFVSGGARKGIVFLSNRPEPSINIQPLPNELPTSKLNAYFYNYTTKSYELLQLTYPEDGDVQQVVPYGMDNFAYLSDKSGISNRYVVLFDRNVNNMDSAYSVPVTNYSSNILYQQYNPASGSIAEVIETPDHYNIYFKEAQLPAPWGVLPVQTPVLLKRVNAKNLGDKNFDIIQSQNLINLEQDKKAITGSGFQVKVGNEFQSEFLQSNAGQTPLDNTEELPDTTTFVPRQEAQDFAAKLSLKDTNTVDNISEIPTINEKDNPRILYVDSTYIELRSQKYRRSFKPDFFSLRLDNNILFSKYQSFTNNGGAFNTPDLSGMLAINLVDKMEDYRFTGGIRIPLSFAGLTYLFEFENLKRRVDWGITFLGEDVRKEFGFSIPGFQNAIFVPGKIKTNYLQGFAAYPFDKTNSVKFHLGIREDKLVIKAQDPIGLALPNTKEYWLMSRAEFVHDDTRFLAVNLSEGMKYKFFAEYMYKLYSDNEFYSIGEQKIDNKAQGFYNVGFDLRRYDRLYKNFIGAVRVAGAHSGGNQQIMYVLGGVDNQLNSSYNNHLTPTLKNNYAFQALATNLRGYNQNARNGNTYAVVNAELRLPVFQTFIKRPIKSTIIRNFQAVAFVDLGHAWEGLLPNEDYADRTVKFYAPSNINPDVTITLPGLNDGGLAVGYGFGVRTTLFSYFLRLDGAWDLNHKYRLHFSIGTDF